MADISSLRVRPRYRADFGGAEEVLRPGERYRPQVRQVSLVSPTSGASPMCVSTGGRRPWETAVFRACALVYWRHGPLFCHGCSEQEGGAAVRPGRARSPPAAHDEPPCRPLPLTLHRKGGPRVAHRSRSAVGVNGSPVAWGRDVGLFWLLGGAVGRASGESLATVARALQRAFTEARP
ncbi:hypothetical protein NN561_014502 [Cricetulus griseus]